MKRLVFLLMLLFGGTVQAQLFEDDFSDGDFTSNPSWSGADSNFVIVDLEGNSVLRLNDNQAATSYLITSSTEIEGFWEFFIRIDGTAPSGSNKAEVILMSDNADLSAAFNGYGVRIGETGDDVFRLIRYDAGNEGAVVLSDTTVFDAGGAYRIKVSRDAAASWSLEVGEGYLGELKNAGSPATDNTYSSASFLGVKVSYTSSRTDDFYFDFKIDEPAVEIEPLEIEVLEQHSDSELNLTFTRDFDFSTVQTGDFLLNNSTNPVDVSELASNQIRIGFGDTFPGGANQLGVSGIRSANNDTVLIDTTLTFFRFEDFEAGDVLINEFSKDPPPGSGLPEYIEIVNQSGKVLNLKDWQVGDNSTLTTISDTDFVLFPDTFLVISSNPEALETTFGEMFSLVVSLPALNNTSDQIRVYDGNDTLVDSLEYTTAWGGVDVALERRSLAVSATIQANWGDSPNNLGGTPGQENDIEQDTTPPDLASFEILNDSTFQLIFTEEIKAEPASNPDNYDIQIPVSSARESVSGENDFVIATYFEPDTVVLEFKQPIYSGSNPNILTISNQEDVFGNESELIQQSYELLATDDPQPGDLVINEIMYDPPEGFSEFVEIYVPETKTFNLKGWTISDNSGEDILITDQTFYIKNDEFDHFSSQRAPNPYVILVPDETIQKNQNQRIVVGSRFPTLNNSTDAIVLKDPNGVVIDSLTYFSSWGGNEVSLERRSPELPSTLRENWGDSPSENMATPAAKNALGLDELPPTLLNFDIISDREIQLIFSERIQDSTATNSQNFGLTNPLSASPVLIRPTEVEFAEPDTITLTFENTFFELNLLEVFNQTDFFGNKNERIAIEFEYVVNSDALAGEVKITEFAYDAPEGFSEFVEIYNPTNKNFDLQGWTFNDNSGNRKRITNKEYFLKAGEYAVLAPDSTIFENFGGIKLLDVPGFPALNNTTDELVLRNGDGVLMDSLTYSSNWGGEEVSLERRSVEFSGIYLENWGDSPAQNLGTPGSPNEITPDTEPPIAVEASFISNTHIQLVFNERLFGESASNPENYNSNAIEAAHLGDTVRIGFNNQFEDGQTVEFQLRNLSDLFGNIQNEQVLSLTYVEVGEATPLSVVFNEILYRRADAVSPEFVELYNPTDSNFDLSCWTFADAGSNVQIPANTILSAGEYLVLTDLEDFAQSLDNGMYLAGFPSLNDDGDELILRNEHGITIDSLFYRSEWGGDSPGISLERKDPAAASFDASNWASSTSESGTSVGQMSAVFEEDSSPPEIVFSSLSDTDLFVAFSEVVRFNANTEIAVNGSPVNLDDQQEFVGSEISLSIEQAKVSKELPTAVESITVSNISDFKGNTANSITSQVAEKLVPGDIIINEILYNPMADNEDNLPDQSEYIELYNRSEKAVSLEGVFIHDAPDEEGEIRAIIPVSTRFKWIAPNEFVLLNAEDEASDFSESKTARFFDLQGVDEQSILLIDRSSLSLASSDDAVFLADSTGATIDSVYFDESWQNPNIFDTRGVALERIDPNGPSNDASNWSSSTHVSGGTPLMENSIYQESGAAPDENGITFSPNPFSPDEDGFEDNLFINFRLDAPDYLLRVRIFDRYGREVRELVNNYQAGFEGSLIWDGLTDDRTKNRVGIYIVLFEAYDSASGKDRTFKETVVLARKF
ncbi:MAG: lamin tail domain-containing protein [Balneolaceae bacterium]|nr:lamin tail domain-containing protein [Balneolaceae bacterium]